MSNASTPCSAPRSAITALAKSGLGISFLARISSARHPVLSMFGLQRLAGFFEAEDYVSLVTQFVLRYKRHVRRTDENGHPRKAIHIRRCCQGRWLCRGHAAPVA